MNKHHPISIYRRNYIRQRMGIMRTRARWLAMVAVGLGFLFCLAAWRVVLAHWIG